MALGDFQTGCKLLADGFVAGLTLLAQGVAMSLWRVVGMLTVTNVVSNFVYQVLTSRDWGIAIQRSYLQTVTLLSCGFVLWWLGYQRVNHLDVAEEVDASDHSKP